MATGGDLGTHGELAISNAQKGMRDDDMHVRVGVFVWAVLGLGGWIVGQMVVPTGFGLPIWATVLIAVCSGIIAVFVSVVLSRSSMRKRDKALAEIRAIDAAEKRRQLSALENVTDRSTAGEKR